MASVPFLLWEFKKASFYKQIHLFMTRWIRWILRLIQWWFDSVVEYIGCGNLPVAKECFVALHISTGWLLNIIVHEPFLHVFHKSLSVLYMYWPLTISGHHLRTTVPRKICEATPATKEILFDLNKAFDCHHYGGTVVHSPQNVYRVINRWVYNRTILSANQFKKSVLHFSQSCFLHYCMSSPFRSNIHLLSSTKVTQTPVGKLQYANRAWACVYLEPSIKAVSMLSYHRMV